ncbi:MAG: hypothetical protein WHU10_11775, partial [Fimbriimonadales bacterium]
MGLNTAEPLERAVLVFVNEDDDEDGADHGGIGPAGAERLVQHVDGRPDEPPVVHRVERPVQRLAEAEVEDPDDGEEP